MIYSTDADLEEVQKDIMLHGVDSWDPQHIAASEIINRAIRVQWFKPLAKTMGHTDAFDADLLLEPETFNRLSIYKALELAYLAIMQDMSENNPFDMKRLIFQELYEAELNAVLIAGISYDWDGSGTIEPDESNISRQPRTIRR